MSTYETRPGFALFQPPAGDTAFLGELQQLEQRNKNFRFVATMTEMNRSRRRWDGETGSINEDLLRRVRSELETPIHYLAGPPALVEALRQALNRVAVDDDEIRSEEFYGY